MKTLQAYFASAIFSAVLFVLVAFLALFAFFDLMSELPSVGRGGYQLQHAFLFVLMGMPGYVYELMPIAVLIGTIYVLAQFASRSEFTIMRASGMSTVMVGWMLVKIGVVFAIITFVFGEFISPIASQAAQQWRLQAQGESVAQEFRSGLWTKDVIREHGITGEVIGTRFVNVREVNPEGQLLDVTLYEFDLDFRLVEMLTASTADYMGKHTWRLSEVAQTRFSKNAFEKIAAITDITAGIGMQDMQSKDLISEITPDILSVLFADPDRMSALALSTYTKHLAENNQSTGRYEIAFWKKIIYPLAVFVMLALALPFAYIHSRAGGVSLKIFAGIMIGVSFQLLNSLFAYLGVLVTWPPFATAVLPSAVFLAFAIGALWWVERH